MKIELHMIQNFAPSCLNRDDTNSPKDCEFGGVRRARISSQCIKRAIRLESSFQEELKEHLATRSRRFPEQVKNALVQLGTDPTVAGQCGQALQAIAKKESAGGSEEEVGGGQRKKRNKGEEEPDVFKTPQIAFYTHDEVRTCAERIRTLLDSGADPKQIVQALLSKKGRDVAFPRPRTADIALFGRMVTSDAFINIDAACQVAHAISTHRVSMEMDFFTAVDDLQPEEEAGAGMMGVVGYNSACFFRYSVLDFNQLERNMGEDQELARRATAAFLRAAVTAIPTGRQNTFAAHSPPSFILAVVRDKGMPISMANAFVRPVRASEKADLVQASVDALAEYWKKLHEVYGTDGVTTAVCCCLTKPSDSASEWGNVATVEKLVDAVLAAIPGGGAS